MSSLSLCVYYTEKSRYTDISLAISKLRANKHSFQILILAKGRETYGIINAIRYCLKLSLAAEMNIFLMSFPINF